MSERTAEQRLLARRRLGSFYLNDVRTLIAERDEARAELERANEALRRAGGQLELEGDVQGAIDTILAALAGSGEEQKGEAR